ncbi:MAG: HAMP domain-containing protein [Chloroflexi bacterium]|nr:HAMP domain-containing protein [Chloroflexota bacterium]
MRQILGRMQWRIAIPYTLLLGGCLLALSAYLGAILSQFQVDALRTRLLAEARLVGEGVLPILLASSGPELSPERRTQIQNQTARLAQRTDARITIVDRRGVVLADSVADPAQMENHANRPEIAAALAGSPNPSSTRKSATLGESELYVASAIVAGGEVYGVARLAVPLTAVNDAIRQILAVVAAALLAITLVAVGMALWIAGRVTGPLRHLTSVADEVARGGPTAVLGMPAEGEIGRLAEAFNQMADQLQAQMLSLAHERDVLASVLTNLADGIVVVSQQGSVVIANEAARRLLDMVDVPDGLSLARAVRDHEICAVLNDSLAQGSSRTEVRRVEHSGRHLRVSAAPLREGGGGLLVLRDVTEERRVENLRRDFVANVSHELRTPIAALKALVETLEDGALDDPPAARDFLRRIHVEVDGLAQLVAELLELSRVESGRAQLKLEAVAPTVLAESAAERLQPQAERAGLRLRWTADDDLPPILADRTRVEHVLLALVHNAIKFTPPGGEVRVGVEADGAFAHFTVADTGSGISAEDLPRIFERFYKVDRARAAIGTGLGLAIAKHVVQALGGRIWAESVLDQGTTVHFTLPTATSEVGGQRGSLSARY